METRSQYRPSLVCTLPIVSSHYFYNITSTEKKLVASIYVLGDGRVILRRLDHGGMNNSGDGYSKCLELTGPETEAICGLSVVGEQQSVWTGSYSAQFFGYRRIAFESLFDL